MVSWEEAEENICKTKNFLKSNLLLSPYRQVDPIKCNDCIFRYLAILIVSGRIRVNKISNKNNSLWLSQKIESDCANKKMHGAKWHDSTISVINNYFVSKGYVSEKEPNLYFGKADLAILDLPIYIEVGTINIYKLLINLVNMKNCTIIVVPSDDSVLEFLL